MTASRHLAEVAGAESKIGLKRRPSQLRRPRMPRLVRFVLLQVFSSGTDMEKAYLMRQKLPASRYQGLFRSSSSFFTAFFAIVLNGWRSF
jgi:hypothetical protein